LAAEQAAAQTTDALKGRRLAPADAAIFSSRSTAGFFFDSATASEMISYKRAELQKAATSRVEP
jgi:hypothetical protein